MDLSSINKIQCKQYALGCYIYISYFLLVLFFHFCSTPALLRHAEEDGFCSCQPESVFAVRGPCWGNLFLLSFFSLQGSGHKDCPRVCCADSHAFSAALCSSCCSSAWLREHKLKYKGLLWPLLSDLPLQCQPFYIIFTWLSSFFFFFFLENFLCICIRHCLLALGWIGAAIQSLQMVYVLEWLSSS